MPTNRKFGITFTLISLVLCFILYLVDSTFLNLSIYALIFFMFTTIFFPKILYLFNIIWFNFGLKLSKITTPLILTFIFYVIFFPFSIFVRFNKTKKFWQKSEKKIKVSELQF